VVDVVAAAGRRGALLAISAIFPDRFGDLLPGSRQTDEARVAPIFVSVDPERDSPAVLKEYVAAFHPRLVGLTGTPQQVADMVKRYGAYGMKGDPTAGGGYNVNHSRVAELIGPDGKPIALLAYDKGAEAVAAELDRWVK